MSDNCLIHASMVEIDGKGVLIKGKSGSGKSDLALRLIEDKMAELIADDMVFLHKSDNKIIGEAPKNIAGMLEVRGIGIVKYPYNTCAKLELVVQLVDDAGKIERMPKQQTDIILGLAINKIDLYARECSAAQKVVAALRLYEQDS